MDCSEAKLAANRKNAARSTGPKTPEGKEASRANAYKHGLAGAGVVLPEREAAEVERRYAAYVAELKPSGEIGRNLALRAATLSVRMERCVDRENADLTDRVRSARAEFEAPEGVDAPLAVKLRVEAGRRAAFDALARAARVDVIDVTTDGKHFDALLHFFRTRERRRRVSR